MRFLKGDPTDPEVQREVLREAIGEFKRLDVLVSSNQFRRVCRHGGVYKNLGCRWRPKE